MKRVLISLVIVLFSCACVQAFETPSGVPKGPDFGGIMMPVFGEGGESGGAITR